MTSLLAYVGAAIAEIAGCFTFWAWLRLGKSAWWLAPGLASLALFAFLLTRVDALAAGRAYAAYGGVYIAASLSWQDVHAAVMVALCRTDLGWHVQLIDPARAAGALVWRAVVVVPP